MRILIQIDCNEAENTSMTENWVQDRFKKYNERIKKEKLEAQWRQNALASYDSIFEELSRRVERDLIPYNRSFAQVQNCAAKMSSVPDGFEVACAHRAAIVTKVNDSTVIKISWGAEDRMGTMEHDKFEVEPDKEGNIRLKHQGNFLRDYSDASEVVLDRILCK
jgi:hypothetical protein